LVGLFEHAPHGIVGAGQCLAHSGELRALSGKQKREFFHSLNCMMKGVRSGTQVSVEEYLNTSYSPDCEYLEGKVLERNLGEYEHARLQTRLAAFLFGHEKQCEYVLSLNSAFKLNRPGFVFPMPVSFLPKRRPNRSSPALPLRRNPFKGRSYVKVNDYLNFGVRYICTKRRTVCFGPPILRFLSHSSTCSINS